MGTSSVSKLQSSQRLSQKVTDSSKQNYLLQSELSLCVCVVCQFAGDDTPVHCSSPDPSHVEMEGGSRQLSHSPADSIWRPARFQSSCVGFLLP